MIGACIRSRHGLIWLPALVLGATVAQLAVATFVPGIERFDDKAFGARLAAYPAMMLLVPAIWWLAVKRRRPDATPPYVAFALIMLGFLVDTTGNSLDFYDSIVWWDDMNHFVNWFFLLVRHRADHRPQPGAAVGAGAAGRRDWAACSPWAGRSASGTRSSGTAPSSTPPTRTRSLT